MKAEPPRPWPIFDSVSWIFVSFFLNYILASGGGIIVCGQNLPAPFFARAVAITYLLILGMLIIRMIISWWRDELVTWDPFIYHCLLVFWPVICLIVRLIIGNIWYPHLVGW